MGKRNPKPQPWAEMSKKRKALEGGGGGGQSPLPEEEPAAWSGGRGREEPGRGRGGAGGEDRAGEHWELRAALQECSSPPPSQLPMSRQLG